MQVNTINNNFSLLSARASGTSAVAEDSSSSGRVINAVYEDEKSKMPTVDMFLQLMIAQMQNQDPMNPVDDTQYVTQMSQIAAMQQMQELAYYSRSNFVMSMVGNDVTVAQNRIGGDIESVTGQVEKISLVGGEYKIYVKGKAYQLNQIMEIHPKAPQSNESNKVITDYGLTLIDTTDKTASIEWETPDKEKDPNADTIRYTVYYSTSPRMDTVSEVKQGTRAGNLEELDVNDVIINGLTPDTTYYVNVVAKDASGNESVYKKISFITDKERA